MSNPASPKYVSMKAVAERWSISEKTVNRLIAAGKLTAFKIGRSVRLDADEVESVLTSNTVGQQP